MSLYTLNFKFLSIFIHKNRFFLKLTLAMVMLYLTCVEDWVDMILCREVKLNCNWINYLCDGKGSSPLGSQFSGKVRRKLQVISPQPNLVPFLKFNVAPVLICILCHILRSLLKVQIYLVVYLCTCCE
jgi:hypothetical protein